ncbi:MAG: hypothetical protein ACRDMJ_07740 [Solirubrobacteraceae bacterium]
MARRALASAVVAVAMVSAPAALLAPAAVARAARAPVINTTEAGYFGSATVTRRISVFVYSKQGPSAGTRVTVCLDGVCRRARGHDARLAWYQATFELRHGLRMWDPVRFTATATDSAGSVRVRVEKPLLCLHNDGSTPQT